jgi:hypothetical protein
VQLSGGLCRGNGLLALASVSALARAAGSAFCLGASHPSVECWRCLAAVQPLLWPGLAFLRLCLCQCHVVAHFRFKHSTKWHGLQVILTALIPSVCSYHAHVPSMHNSVSSLCFANVVFAPPHSPQPAKFCPVLVHARSSRPAAVHELSAYENGIVMHRLNGITPLLISSTKLCRGNGLCGATCCAWHRGNCKSVPFPLGPMIRRDTDAHRAHMMKMDFTVLRCKIART